MLQTQNRSTQNTFIRFPVDSLVSTFVRKFPRDVEIGPVLSRDILEDFSRPEEQEDILELRKQAISDWLSQLPKGDCFVEEANSSPSQTLTNIAICSNKQTNEEWRSRILDSQEFEECYEDSLEWISQPSEFQSPLKSKQDSRQLQSVRNHTESDRNSCTSDPEFDQQINFRIPHKSLKLDLGRLSPRAEQTNNSDDNFWSVISHSNDISPQKNTTHNSHLTNHKNQHCSEDLLFHVKYKASSLTFQPFTDRSSCTQSIFPMFHPKAPKGDWWLPNVCFAASEEAMDDDSSPHSILQEEASILPELPERIQQRLMQGYRANLRLPTRRRLISRMKEARNRQESKTIDLSCALECPCDLKKMLDLKDSRKVNFSMAPETQVMEYSAPPSLDGLSDFDGGPLFSSLTFNQETAFHFCQNWIFDKVLCFFTGSGRSWSGNPPY